MTNGAHFAAIVGGYIGQGGGWQWGFWTGAILTAFAFVLALFLLPETLLSRDPAAWANKTRERTFNQMLWDSKGE